MRYDSTFAEPDANHRLQASVIVGLPIYYKVENSQFPDVRWVENFKGYDASADVGYAYRIYKAFMLSTHAEYCINTDQKHLPFPLWGGAGHYSCSTHVEYSVIGGLKLVILIL